MTMPHLMNCNHSDDGWCLDCVKRLHDENEKMRQALKRARAYAVNRQKEHPLGLCGFATECGVSPSTLSDWTSDFPKTDPDIICKRK